MSPAQLWRLQNDSSFREVPLVMVRILMTPEQLETAITLYERLLRVPCDLRFEYPEMSLRLASIGNVLLIAGNETALESFRATAMTLLVASLDEYLERFDALGVEVVSPPKAVPTGRNLLARHPDGTLVEYVEHRRQPGEAG
ncbi:MAG: VOC family protein [Candidatus Dormibacteraceae bacterium]